MSDYIPADLRKKVIARAKDICEYCHTQQELSPSTFRVDHIIPRSRRGRTTLANLALACEPCNSAKWKKMTGVDPPTKRRVRLFHPRRQKWSEHFTWNEDFTEVIGKTACGRATVETLNMNQERIVNLRMMWRQLKKHPPEEE
jgi:hypothetical protein